MNPGVFQEAALRIAHELAAGAVWHEDMCAFHGALTPDPDTNAPRFGSLGGDLYEGSAGIARFLAQAAAVARDESLRRTALGAWRHADARTQGWPLFTGGMGTGMVALELARILQVEELAAEGARWIHAASDAAMQSGGPWDLLTGTAGVIVALAGTRWHERALALGHGLLEAGVPDGLADPQAEPPEQWDGPPLSWPLAPGSPLRLCGLAHGASGIALAFEALGRLAPGDPQWRRAARQARAFERAHYSSEHGSWADLREPAAIGYPHMWCHGSAGIAAERLGAIHDDLLARADAAGGLAGAKAYARSLLAGPAGPGGSDALNGSLCHGVASLIDLFIDAWQATGDTAWMALASELGELVVNDGRRVHGWRSGIQGGWPTPGLMLGAAGTGWTLLRLANPEALPSGWRF